MHWPTAAAACFIRSSVGRSFSPSFVVPMAMAPEETRTISCPMPSRSDSVRAKRSILCRFSRPVSWVRVEVPTLTTMRWSLHLFHHVSRSKVRACRPAYIGIISQFFLSRKSKSIEIY